MIRETLSIAALVILLVARPVCAAAAPSETEGVNVTVTEFHDALRRGDGEAAMRLLAADAIVMEGGAIETRADYESHHLAADMEFAKAVPNTRSNIRVQVDGNTAWLTSASRAQGSFRERAIDSLGAELMVLTKTPEGWRIRAIHWSSRKAAR